jgi:ketol-acid reductoisomerase
MIALWAVHQDASGNATGICHAYGKAIGCARAGLLESSFAEEAEADLFNEQAVVWGGVPALLQAGFETLVAGGIAPEVAYLECVGELSLIAALIEERGIAGMREAISNTAELGAVLGGSKIVDKALRARMAKVLEDVRAGTFARALAKEEDAGYPMLDKARSLAWASDLEMARRRLEGEV